MSAEAEAFGVEPTPASLLKRPLLIPYMTHEPLNPPKIASKSNASLNIVLKTEGSVLIFKAIIVSATSITLMMVS